MSKNQPRDGNGKFAKKPSFIALYGNNNTVALFETVEDMEKFAKENGMGIPKERSLKNPDCEPATKGYVKCQIRKLISVSGHSHGNHDELCGALGLLSLFAFIGSLVVSFLLYFVPPGAGSIYSLAQCQTVACYTFTFCTVMGVICGSCLIAECKDETEPNTIIDEDSTPSEFQKYEPPCEKKDRCE